MHLPTAIVSVSVLASSPLLDHLDSIAREAPRDAAASQREARKVRVARTGLLDDLKNEVKGKVKEAAREIGDAAHAPQPAPPAGDGKPQGEGKADGTPAVAAEPKGVGVEADQAQSKVQGAGRGMEGKVDEVRAVADDFGVSLPSWQDATKGAQGRVENAGAVQRALRAGREGRARARDTIGSGERKLLDTSGAAERQLQDLDRKLVGTDGGAAPATGAPPGIGSTPPPK